jgi:hypothetical protein
VSVPDDKELITLLRQRNAQVDEAIHSFLEVLEATGKRREAAWHAMKADMPEDIADSVYRFLRAYEDTMPARTDAAADLMKALTMDFRTALLCAADSTPEQIEYWLGTHDEAPK